MGIVHSTSDKHAGEGNHSKLDVRVPKQRRKVYLIGRDKDTDDKGTVVKIRLPRCRNH